MAGEDAEQVASAFIDTSQEMISRLKPFIHALVTRPGREDIVPEVVATAFRLFHFVKGKGTALGFDHLAAPAAAMEYLLDRVRSGGIGLTPPRIELLAKTCGFLEQGFALVREVGSDRGVADAAAELTSALRQAVFAEQESCAGRGSACAMPEQERETFFWEMEQLVAAAEQECVLWDFIVVDPERVTELSRMMSRMKQCFGLYDFHDPERMCLSMASTLNRFVQGECFQTNSPERVFIRCLDTIRTALTAFPASNNMVVPDLERHLAALQGLMRQPLGELLIEAGLADAATIDQALAIQRSAPEGQSRRLGEVLVDMGQVTTAQIEDALREQHDKRALAQEAEVVRDARGQAAPESPLAVTIDGRKLERVHLLLEQLLALQPPEQYQEHLAELQKIVRSWLHDAFAALAGRLRRAVHDFAAEHNKQVHFMVEGIETLKEAGEAAVLVDCLFHLLRNSVEHGLEAAGERTHAGKKTAGRLQLLILRKDGEIWLSVEDDGRGFDGERMDALLIERGLLTVGDTGRLTNQERFALLSSKPSHRPIAGNGWEHGLIVVRERLRSMKGTIDVATRPGRGTRITLKVPRRS